MKKTLVAAILMTLLAAGGAVAFGGGFGPGNDGRPGPDPERHARKLEMMSVVLDLSESQKAQIEEVFKAGFEAAEPYHEQMRQAREQIRDLVTSGSYDEAKVRELAQKVSSAEVELMVAKARTHSQVYALLTPEQRQKADKLAPLFEGRRGHHGRHGGGRCR